MKKANINPMPDFFDRYINLVAEDDLMTAFRQNAQICDAPTLARMEALGDYVYAPGKWTTRDLMQHIIDNERVQAYRAMRFARNDQTALPGYDETLFASESKANNRTFSDLVAEFAMVRAGNIALFQSFDEEILARKGVCFQREISVLGLGFVLVGHQIHHINVLKERYLK